MSSVTFMVQSLPDQNSDEPCPEFGTALAAFHHRQECLDSEDGYASAFSLNTRSIWSVAAFRSSRVDNDLEGVLQESIAGHIRPG